jgi:hypothetical protein
VKSSVPKAATNPSMANLPLMISGAGPLKANISMKLGVFNLGATGVGVGGTIGVVGIDGVFSERVDSASGSALHRICTARLKANACLDTALAVEIERKRLLTAKDPRDEVVIAAMVAMMSLTILS